MEVMDVDGVPHVYLVAKAFISANVELLYDYGDRSKVRACAHCTLAVLELARELSVVGQLVNQCALAKQYGCLNIHFSSEHLQLFALITHKFPVLFVCM
jgi:hypothetical protein